MIRQAFQKRSFYSVYRTIFNFSASNMHTNSSKLFVFAQKGLVFLKTSFSVRCYHKETQLRPITTNQCVSEVRNTHAQLRTVFNKFFFLNVQIYRNEN